MKAFIAGSLLLLVSLTAFAEGGKKANPIVDDDGEIRGYVNSGLICEEYEAPDQSGIVLVCQQVDSEEPED
jgi:hypothetical protein